MCQLLQRSGLFLILFHGIVSTSVAKEQPKLKPGPSADNPHLWSPRTKSVALFKNGFGFFLREGEVALRDGWAVAKDIPPAAFGTLAIYSANKDEVVDIVGAGPGEIVDFDGVDAPKDAAAKRDRLTAANHLNVQLTYDYHGADRQAAGKIVSVGDEFVVLETSSNSFAVPVEAITRLQVLELPLRIHVSSDLEKPAEKTTLGMAYLREGITWIPEYSLRVLDETTAELTLRGTVVNEAEDLIHCDVNFVVGVPHFTHTQFLAPIAVGQIIRTIGSAVAPPEIRGQMMNRAAIANNTVRADQLEQAGVVDVPVTADGGKLKAALGSLPQLENAGGTDYTVYTKKDLLTEAEADRKFKAHSPADHVFYDLVSLNGELRLKNFEKMPVELVIVVSVPGLPVEASDDGARAADPQKLKLLERAGTIRWVVKLKPDEMKTIKYKYERYVPSH